MTAQNSNFANLTAFLAGKGEGAAQIAGIEGNAKTESGGNPASYNAKEGAIGLFQWEGGRRTGPHGLDAYAAAHGGSETDLAMQEGFLWSELTGPYSKVLAQINNTSDPGTVAAIFDVGPGGKNSGTGFENSSGSATSQRMANARSIYQNLSGVPLTGLAGGTAAGGTSGAQGVASGVQSASFPGGIIDPLNWPGMLIGGAAGAVLKVVLPFAAKAFFVIGGLGVVGLGLFRASAPVRHAAEQAGGTAAKAAALAA
jgi:hypothetical protein